MSRSAVISEVNGTPRFSWRHCQPDLSRGGDAHTLSVSALLLKVAGRLLVSGVLVALYVGDFHLILLCFLGVRHVEHDGTNLCLAVGAGILVGLLTLDGDVVFLSDLGILCKQW
jgi:hypothetical protein